MTEKTIVKSKQTPKLQEVKKAPAKKKAPKKAKAVETKVEEPKIEIDVNVPVSTARKALIGAGTVGAIVLISLLIHAWF